MRLPVDGVGNGGRRTDISQFAQSLDSGRVYVVINSDTWITLHVRIQGTM